MKPVDQTTFGHPGGNCFSACVASLLELSIDDVPYFMDEEDGKPKWYEQLDSWLAPRGFYALHFDVVDRERTVWPKGFYIRIGKSSRGDHAVVGRGGAVVFDPHPSREGLIAVDGFTIIALLFDGSAGPGAWGPIPPIKLDFLTSYSKKIVRFPEPLRPSQVDVGELAREFSDIYNTVDAHSAGDGERISVENFERLLRRKDVYGAEELAEILRWRDKERLAAVVLLKERLADEAESKKRF